MKSIRIYLTENCNAKCPWCFNRDTRDRSKDMDLPTAKKLVDYLCLNRFQRLSIMGGEPTIHPDFVEFYNYVSDRMEIMLFTNGTMPDKIESIKVRPSNTIVYNFDFLKEPFDDKLFSHDCKYILEICLRLNSDIDKLIEDIESIRKYEISNNLMFYYNITLDCTANLFTNKALINSKLNQLLDYALTHRDINWKWDHGYPKCVISHETFSKMVSLYGPNSYFSLCLGMQGCAGLITSDFKLVHCNQYRNEELNIINPDGSFIPYERFRSFLIMENFHKIESLRNTSCMDCPYFMSDCNGACTAQRFNH